MEIDTELDKLRNEVLRKIGRNVMLFQQVEHMLKYLLANSKVSGYASELTINKEQRAATIGKQTMGKVANQFFENVFSESVPEETSNSPEELKELWFDFRYTVQCEQDYYQERKNALTSIITERNDLIHHLLPKWDSSLTESCIEIDLYLEQQREKILPEIELLKEQIKNFREAVKEHVGFLSSTEGKKSFNLSFLRQSQLVAWLFEIAKQQARTDGWVVLSNAVHHIRQQVPHELADLEKKHGYKKLKEIILATEYFDIYEEPTTKSGVRLLYRIKPDLNFIE